MLRPPHEEVRNFFNHEYQMIGILQPKDDEFETWTSKEENGHCLNYIINM